MHAFMSAILLVVSRIEVYRFDTIFDKPDGQTGQALNCLNSAKWPAIVGMDLPGQAEFTENPAKFVSGWFKAFSIQSFCGKNKMAI